MTKRPQQVLDQNQKEIIHLYKFIGRKCEKASTFLCLRTLCELYSQRPHKPLQSVDVLFNQSYRGLFNHANLSCLSVKCRLQVIYFLRIPIHPQFFDRVKYDFELLLDVTGRIRYGKEKNRQFVLGSQDFTRPLLEYVYQHDLLHFMAEFCQDQKQPVSDKELAENYVKNNKCVLPISELIKQINIVKPAIQKEQNYHYLTIIKILFMIQYPVNDYYEKKIRLHGHHVIENSLLLKFLSKDRRISLSIPSNPKNIVMPKDVTESLIDHSGYTKPKGKPVMQRTSKREIPTTSEISSEASGSQEEDPPIARSSLNATSVRHLSPGDSSNVPSASKKSRVELEVAQKLLPIHDSAYHSNEQQPTNCLPANPLNPVTSNSGIFPKPSNGYNWEMSHVQKHHVNTHENLTEKCILPDHPDLLSPTPIEKGYRNKGDGN